MPKMPKWPKLIRAGQQQHINYKLDRMYQMLEQLGNPHEKLPKTIHVAGTNGKGSTCAFLRSILEQADYKVHAYTSPHLIRFNERIRIHGSEIDDNYLDSILLECREACEALGVEPTFFEGTTLAAFLAFSRIPADYLVLEVGLGGTLDATNVIKDPVATIITSISLDHTEFLGNSLEEIALNKAGIMKKGAPCIISQQYENVENLLLQVAETQGIESLAYGYDFIIEPHDNGFTYKSKTHEFVLPAPSLPGLHQYLNAANAIATISILEPQIDEQIIAKGITNTKWIARLQKLEKGKLFKELGSNIEIWVDGAHNIAGAHVVTEWLKDYKKDKKLYIILGMTGGRDIRGFITPLAEMIDSLYGVYINNEPSSYNALKIVEETSAIGINSFECDSIEDAIMKAKEDAKNQDAMILILGSLYLAGEALEKNQGVLV